MDYGIIRRFLVVNLLLYWLGIVLLYKTHHPFLKTEEHRLEPAGCTLFFSSVHAEVIANLKSRDNLLSFFSPVVRQFLDSDIFTHQKSLKHLFAGCAVISAGPYSQTGQCGLIPVHSNADGCFRSQIHGNNQWAISSGCF